LQLKGEKRAHEGEGKPTPKKRDHTRKKKHLGEKNEQSSSLDKGGKKGRRGKKRSQKKKVTTQQKSEETALNKKKKKDHGCVGPEYMNGALGRKKGEKGYVPWRRLSYAPTKRGATKNKGGRIDVGKEVARRNWGRYPTRQSLFPHSGDEN